MKSLLFPVIAVALTFSLQACRKDEWKPGAPLAKEKIRIGVVHINDPFSESSGYSYAHEMGIQEMKKKLRLEDSQLLYKINVDDQDLPDTEGVMRELIAQGVNIIIATAEGYASVCEKLADEYPNIIFTQLYANSRNSSNLTGYFGRAYQARYLSGIVAGLRTRTNKIGFVAAWGKEHSQVTSGLNAFAMGVERVNPQARVYVKITHSWFDPMGEAAAARALIASGCDIIAQHCDTPTPQIEAEKAHVWGIGYNTDMSADAPGAVLTSVLWRWGAYYSALVQSLVDGTFTTASYFGSLKDGVVDIAALHESAGREPELVRILGEERQRIESGAFDVFSGIMETNDGRLVGRAGENLSDDEIRSGLTWYYRTIIEM